MIRLIMITNAPVLARQAQRAGIERIFVDLEQIGKQERQGHLDTLISSHSMEDVIGIRRVLDSSELIVRINPLHVESGQEIEKAIENGADILMLPMFRKAAEVAEVCAKVDGRVSVMPLVETIGAVDCLSEVVDLPGVSEIYIGLNDLHLEMGLKFMFEPLADGLLDTMAVTIKRAGLPFGFGGIARVGEGSVPGELILAEHAR
ncbi:MAG: aldolase, partial [Gammaproteobacteria bacterium]|nr:aldolase [Gammaproteobacteria bacterium]